MSKQYLKPDFKVINMQMMDIMELTGVNSENQGVGYGGWDDGGFIDPSGNFRNSSEEAFWSWREDDD